MGAKDLTEIRDHIKELEDLSEALLDISTPWGCYITKHGLIKNRIQESRTWSIYYIELTYFLHTYLLRSCQKEKQSYQNQLNKLIDEMRNTFGVKETQSILESIESKYIKLEITDSDLNREFEITKGDVASLIIFSLWVYGMYSYFPLIQEYFDKLITWFK